MKTRNSSVGFIIFSPDCTTTGRYLQAIDWFRQRGVVFRRFAWKRLKPAETAALYATNRQHRKEDPMDLLVDRLFALDHSLGALVTIPCAQDVHDRLKQLKGPSDPTEASPTHLRRFLGATNKILNFVHTSDDTLAAESECEVFFKGLGQREILEVEGASPVPPESLAHTPTVSIFSTLCELKRRIVTRLPAAQTSRFQELLAAEGALLQGNRDHLAVFCELRALNRRQLEEIRAWNPSGIETVDFLKQLCLRSMRNQVAETEPSITQWMKKIGFEVTPWEDLILACDHACPAKMELTDE